MSGCLILRLIQVSLSLSLSKATRSFSPAAAVPW